MPPQADSFLLKSFRELSVGRSGALPWAALDAYARRYNLTDDAFERFCAVMRAADDVWLAAGNTPT